MLSINGGVAQLAGGNELKIRTVAVRVCSPLLNSCIVLPSSCVRK